MLSMLPCRLSLGSRNEELSTQGSKSKIRDHHHQKLTIYESKWENENILVKQKEF